MPPRQPPADIPPDASYELQWRTSKSFATSYRFNPRNLEAHWYGIWQLVLNRLIRDRPDFLVIPQFPLYYIPSDVGDNEYRAKGQNPDDPDDIDQEDVTQDEIEEPDADPGRQPEIDAPILPELPIPLPDPPPPSPPPSPPRTSSCILDPDVSIADSLDLPDWDRSSAVPDFCIFHSCTIKSKLKAKNAFRYKALAGVQVVHSCCPTIMENKRAPSRMLSSKQTDLQVVELLNEAMDSLLSHTKHYFQMFPKSRSVIVIATAGEYWKHKVVLYSKTFAVGEKSKMSEGERAVAWSKLIWKGPFELGTKESDDELAKLEKKMKAKKPLSLDGH